MIPNDVPKKLVVVGDGACGKTSLLTSYCNNAFSEIYLATIFETYLTSVKFQEKEIIFALWDTAGEEDYDRLRPLSYPRTDIVLVCFSVDNPASLLNVVLKWYPEIKHFCPSIPVVLVATKLDLRYNKGVEEVLRERNMTTVSYAEGLSTSKRIKAAGYIECSAKTMEGVKNVFRKAAEIVDRERTVEKRQCVVL